MALTSLVLIFVLVVHSSSSKVLSEQVSDHEERVSESESSRPKLLQAPVVQNPIPDQEIIVGELLTISLRNVFADADGDFLTLSAKLSTGNLLPSWMSLSLPSFLGSYDTPDKAYGISVNGTAAFVADWSGGLQIIDVSDPSNSIFLGSYPSSASQSVVIRDDVAFMADLYDRFQIVNISDINNPTFLGSYFTGNAHDLSVRDTTAFVAIGSGLHIIDISDLSNPTPLVFYETPGQAYGVTISNTTVFVADYHEGLHIIDISDLNNPTFLGSYNTSGIASNVIVSGDIAFVADGADGLQIINVSDLNNPTFLGSYNTSGIAWDVDVRDTTAFVADQTGGLQIIDVRDPSNPTFLDSYDTPGSARAVTVSGTIAFVADWTSGLQIIDIGDWSLSGIPTFPSDVGSYTITLTASDGISSIEESFTLTVTNKAPTVAIAIPNQSTTGGEAFIFQFNSSTFDDADGHVLSYTATLANNGTLPSWLSFNAAIRTFSGISKPGDQGTSSVKVTADDGFGGTVEDIFTLTVTNENPTLDNLITEQSTAIGETFIFQFNLITFSDADGHVLSYTAILVDNIALPSWLSFAASVRTFSGIPVSGDQGISFVEVTADDGFGGVVTDTFSLVVTNRFPSLDNLIPNQTSVVAQSYLYQFPDNTFSDDDLDILTYVATLENGDALPTWLTFNDGTRTFSGIPNPADQNILSITVTASDSNGGFVSDTFGLAVDSSSIGGNIAPALTFPIQDQQASVRQFFSFTFDSQTFVDGNGAPLNYNATRDNGDKLPEWLFFDDTDRTFRGTPMQKELGEIAILVTATDPQGLSAIDVFMIIVVDVANYASVVINPISRQTANVGKDFSFTIPDTTFNDPNGDTLSYSTSSLPKWLNFDPETRTFSGTPGKSDTNTYGDKDHLIEIMASDGQLTTTTTFTVSVTGASHAELMFKIMVFLASVLGAALGAYKNRGFFINHCKKKRYIKPKETASVGAMFVRQLSVSSEEIKKVIATIKDTGCVTTIYLYMGKTKRKLLPGEESLPPWMKYDLNKNALIGTPSQNERYSELTIQVLGNGGVIKEQFDLTVKRNHLEMHKINIYDEGASQYYT
uniref:Putative Ig domain protein n=1 Tax=Pithovirus LCPAC404 TaxID=2506597 RepID=A0A481ZEV8_9VIRU|nr:MAG: putative Ig domain protein [Pithovirus LCPAC404]